MEYKNLLKSNKYNICIWGSGYIGLSTAVYFSRKGIKCLALDVDKDKVKKIKEVGFTYSMLM